jgi:signal transduction histidine kinase/CheY-like chemotaxis protein
MHKLLQMTVPQLAQAALLSVVVEGEQLVLARGPNGGGPAGGGQGEQTRSAASLDGLPPALREAFDQAIEQGEAVDVPVWGRAAQDPMLWPAGLRGARVLPLKAGEQSFGALMLGSPKPPPAWGVADQAMLGELASRAGMALENARLYWNLKREIARTREAEEKLLDASRRKDEFLAMLSHELRNPLAPIRNSLHVFRMVGIKDPTVERVAAMMERQVEHMVRMVDDLLEVSRISRGKIELRRERVELASILRNAVDASRPLIEAARHEFAVELPEASLMLDADPVRLSQVFANLLNNAAKYTPEGGRITLHVAVEAGMATVCVRDNGEGIPPGMLNRVFNMFTQVDTGARAQGGLGIGLTLAKTLVQLHGGSIEAHSEGKGRGCEFTVKLPLAQATALEPAGQSASASEPLRFKRVLVVDDNQDAADSLGILLQLLGAEVMVVHDGPSALDALESFKPAVVLLDLGMPGMGGLEVARRMREDPGHGAITLVALTGWGQREDRRRTHEAGFDYHLVKPADMGTLQDILAVRDLEATPKVRH